jgi:serine/threonine-protein kinase
MGIVYKAQHKFLKTTRAVKVIKSELVGNDSSFATRFQQEAMAAAAIGHPNIISVPDYGFLNGEVPFLVMEFIEGDSLQDVMTREGKFSPEKALEYIKVIASGVGAAHAHGIVHRDLKPLNIMLNRGNSPRESIRILDFGLAKIKSGELFGSFVGAKTTGIIGSPYYMAPEQWSDEEPDKRCDIYSLGIILHQMLTGDVPFKGSSIPAVMKKHLMTPPPPLANAKGGISPELERVVHHALEKDPKARTASAEEFVAELENAVQVTAGKASSKRRSAAKPRTSATRTKAGSAGRVSTRKKAVGPDGIDISLSALGQTEPDEANQSQPGPEFEGATVVLHQSSQPQIEDSWPTSIASDSLAHASMPDSMPDVESPPAPPADIKVSLQTGQPAADAVSEPLTPPPVQLQDSKGQLLTSESDALRRAAEDARRRAEERAFREADSIHEISLSPRVPSLAPPAVVSRPFIADEVQSSPSQLAELLKKPLVLGVAAAVILVVAGVISLVYLWPSVQTPPVTTTGETTKAPTRDMVLIKGGAFNMGSDEGVATQKPPHLVSVVSFYLDKTEVTNAEYAAFVKASGHAPPTNDDADPSTKGYWKPWNGTDPPAGRERWPVCNVSPRDAEDFAQWLSKQDGVRYRLPTEQEWEYAARNGSTGSLFPWGNSWGEGLANLNRKTSPRDVGSFPDGRTQLGLQDMIGNVWEWTASTASYYDGKSIKPEEATARIRRGGSFADIINESFRNATDRGWYSSANGEQYKFPSIGFRLARDGQ